MRCLRCGVVDTYSNAAKPRISQEQLLAAARVLTYWYAGVRPTTLNSTTETSA